MIRITNVNSKTGERVTFSISVEMLQGGVSIEADEFKDGKNTKSVTTMLNPTSACAAAYNMKESGCAWCERIGPDNAKFSVRPTAYSEYRWNVEDASNDVLISVGDIVMCAPRFVVDAIRIAIESMMVSILHPSTDM